MRMLLLASAAALMVIGNSAHAATDTWTGATSTDFENAGNWTPALPTSDTTTDIGQFQGTVTANQPTLTTSRSINGLVFSTGSGGWTLGSTSTSNVLTIGSNGISTIGQTSGTNTISANLNVGAAQTWVAGSGAILDFLGQLTGSSALTINSTGNTGTVRFSGASPSFTGSVATVAGTLTVTGTLGSIATPLASASQATNLTTVNVNGGTLIATSYTENTTVSGASLNLNGGTITLTGNFSQNSNNASQTALFVLNSGTFSSVNFTTGRDATAVSSLPSTGVTNRGVYVNGATANISGALTIGGNNANSSANFRVDTGSVTVSGQAQIELNNSGRWSVLDVTNTGSFTSGSILLGSGNAGNDTLIIRNNAVVSTGTITLGSTGGGQQSIQLFGGTLNVGAGGIVAGGSAATTLITFGQASSTVAPTLAASADWSSSLNMTLVTSSSASPGIPIIKAADALGNAHNIVLSGALSGSGGFIKTGAGTLTLAGTNTYSGGTTLTSGTLSVASTGNLGTGNITLTDTTAAVLTLANASTIADTATLTFGNNNRVNFDAAGGSETLAALFDSTTSQLFNTPGTYTAGQLDTAFGGIAVFSAANGETITIAAIPEPTTWTMMIAGAGMLFMLRRRSRKS